MSGKLRRDTLALAEEAAEWLDALESGNAQVNADFIKWLHASPRHLEEFLLLTASDHACSALDSGRTLDVDALIAGATENVLRMHAATQADASFDRHAKARTWRLAASIAASVAALALTGAWWLGALGWQTYLADVGEQRAIELADGSLVHLNARSRIKVRFSSEKRDIRLLEGEALFKVARDARRPFRVAAGDTMIRAVGTQFNVNRRTDDTKVAVIEGRVEITMVPGTSSAANQAPPSVETHQQRPEQFSAGEEARIVGGGKVFRAKANVAEATAWRQRRLIFRDSTLAEIAAEFNRYNRTPQFVIEDDAVRTQRFGGTFDADEPESLIAFLRSTPGLAIENEKDRLLIRRR